MLEKIFQIAVIVSTVINGSKFLVFLIEYAKAKRTQNGTHQRFLH